MHTILGAGGAVGNELAKELRGKRVRAVGRNPRLVAGATEAAAADVSALDQTVNAVAGSTVVYLVVGLKYDLKVWQALWPRIMRNTSRCANGRTRSSSFLIPFTCMEKSTALLRQKRP
jgi:hypothetical protein